MPLRHQHASNKAICDFFTAGGGETWLTDKALYSSNIELFYTFFIFFLFLENISLTAAFRNKTGDISVNSANSFWNQHVQLVSYIRDRSSSFKMQIYTVS